MKKRTYYLFIAFAAICCLIFLTENAAAASSDFSKKYSGKGWDGEEEEDSYDFTLKYKCKLTVSINFSNADKFDTLFVQIYKTDSDFLYDEDEDKPVLDEMV